MYYLIRFFKKIICVRRHTRCKFWRSVGKQRGAFRVVKCRANVASGAGLGCKRCSTTHPRQALSSTVQHGQRISSCDGDQALDTIVDLANDTWQSEIASYSVGNVWSTGFGTPPGYSQRVTLGVELVDRALVTRTEPGGDRNDAFKLLRVLYVQADPAMGGNAMRTLVWTKLSHVGYCLYELNEVRKCFVR